MARTDDPPTADPPTIDPPTAELELWAAWPAKPTTDLHRPWVTAAKVVAITVVVLPVALIGLFLLALMSGGGWGA